MDMGTSDVHDVRMSNRHHEPYRGMSTLDLHLSGFWTYGLERLSLCHGLSCSEVTSKLGLVLMFNGLKDYDVWSKHRTYCKGRECSEEVLVTGYKMVPIEFVRYREGTSCLLSFKSSDRQVLSET